MSGPYALAVAKYCRITEFISMPRRIVSIIIFSLNGSDRLSSPFHIFLVRILGDTNEEYSRFHVICAWVQFVWSQLCSHYSPPGYLCSSHWKAKQNKTKKKNKHRQGSSTITIFAIIDERLPKTFCGFPKLTFSDLSQFFFWLMSGC